MGILKTLTEEYFEERVRDDEGRIFEIDEKKYILKFKDFDFLTNITTIDDNGDKYFIKKKFDFFTEPVFICLSMKDGLYNFHYITESDLHSVKGKIISKGFKPFASSDYDLTTDDFLMVKVMYELGDSEYFDKDEEIFVKETPKEKFYEIENNGYSFYVYDDRDNAISDAVERTYDYLDGEFSDSMSERMVQHYTSVYGTEWIDEDEIKEAQKEYYSDDYIDNIKREKGEHGNRFYDELIEQGIIEDTTDYFKCDLEKQNFDFDEYREDLIQAIIDDKNISEKEAVSIVDDYDTEEQSEALIKYGLVEKTEEYFELDYNSPLFDDDDYSDEFGEKMSEDYTVDDEIFNSSGILYHYYYDLRKLAELCVDVDGPEKELSTETGEEYEVSVDDETFYIYI